MVEFGTSNKTLCRMSELLPLESGRPARTSFRFQPASSFILIYLTQVMLNLHSTRDGEAFNLFQNTARVFFRVAFLILAAVQTQWSTILVDQLASLIGQLIDVIDQRVSQSVNEAILTCGSNGLANKSPTHKHWPTDQQKFFVLPKTFFQLISTSLILPKTLPDSQCTWIVIFLLFSSSKCSVTALFLAP